MSIEEMTDRELIRGLMRGNRRELKLGYSPANAEIAVMDRRPTADRDELRGYSQGFSDGMRRAESLYVGADPPNVENEAYRAGYRDGLEEDEFFIYPSRGAI